MADGWFPSVSEGDRAVVIDRLRQYTREAGRDPSEVGLQGSVAIAARTPAEWVQPLNGWRELGATHIAANTNDAGSTADEHIEALRRFKEAVDDVAG